MNQAHPSRDRIWAYLAGQCQDREVVEHLRDCTLCKDEAQCWREIFRSQKEELDRQMESLPETFWQGLEEGIRSRLLSARKPFFGMSSLVWFPVTALLLLLALWVGRSHYGIGSVTEEQLNLIAELSVDFSDLPSEEALFQRIAGLIDQPLFGDLILLYPEDDWMTEKEAARPSPASDENILDINPS